MHELDHDNKSRFSCNLCQESGIDIETREYCTACELGKRRMNLDRLAEPLRHHPFTDAMWIAHHSAIKAERAIAAADKALLVDRAQRAEAAKLNAEGRAFEMTQKLEQVERDLAEVQKDAERYRFLRACDWYDSPLCVLRDPKRVLTQRTGLGVDCPSGSRLDSALDEAIDAASVAQAKKEQG